ncbi:hypothetical protein SPRG_09466 [Saprolegnia parasitica CBS 223.65]|uniref:Integrase catalytic domain-containing protein n=1 Tax=Saprolegnia parasitica (strain CBS 223.65) TaxID=695850 RepID=A0A067CEK5_SAPPC|nr:hypothetical protein SPRG_09466 [Saprolegnia parasitica CBS 223.65]KDO25217.1 hypothetical protein SPRG_09466 [Saprolegnia parasitica CBS 223.65]|eukprot:XP_012204054.1 hypothetical protein SPRG_09466 [Saprolegnia parasitica CBS 223.65]
MGHRSKFAMKMHLKRLFRLHQLDVKLTAFMNQCLLWPHVKGGRVIQRPHSQIWHANRPNEGIHFDFLYLGDSFKGSKYVLVLKDDLTHYCELVVCLMADAASVVDALMHWATRFRLPLVWASDQGSHFKNQVVAALAQAYKVDDQFIWTYSCGAMGYLLPLVQVNLNQTPAESLGGVCPTQAFTGHVPATILDIVVRYFDGELVRQED